MISKDSLPSEIARGILLVGVLHIHALYTLVSLIVDSATTLDAWLQIKIFAPDVVMFFALSGMTSRSIGDKSFFLTVNRSLMLVFIALASHVVGAALQFAIYEKTASFGDLLVTIAKPLATGTGYSTFVAWFFLVLAITRIFAYLAVTDLRIFASTVLAAAAVVAAATALGAPDNIYEWRNWPAAFLMFMLGMKIPEGWRVPHWLGLPAAIVTLVLARFNSPTFLEDGFCLACHPHFTAQPMIGRFGFLPVYALQQFLFVFGLLWVSQLVALTPLARFFVYFGRRSLKMLLLHGWVILTVYGLAAYVLPRSGGALLFVAILLANSALHAGLYELLSGILDRFMMVCSVASRKVTAGIQAVARWRPTPAPPG